MGINMTILCDSKPCATSEHGAYRPIIFEDGKETFADWVQCARDGGWEVKGGPEANRMTATCPKCLIARQEAEPTEDEKA